MMDLRWMNLLPGQEFIDDHYFHVILRGPNDKLILPKHKGKHVKFNGLKLNDRQISALEKMFGENISFSNKSYSEFFDISLTSSKRDLVDLFQKELVNKKKIKNTY